MYAKVWIYIQMCVTTRTVNFTHVQLRTPYLLSTRILHILQACRCCDACDGYRSDTLILPLSIDNWFIYTTLKLVHATDTLKGIYICFVLFCCLFVCFPFKGLYVTSFFFTPSLDSISAKPEPINWDFYAKNISKPGMVEAFRKAVSWNIKLCIIFPLIYLYM